MVPKSPEILPIVTVQPEELVKSPRPVLARFTVPPSEPVQVRVESSVLSLPSKVTVAPVMVRVPPEEVKLLSTDHVPVVAVWVPPETVKEPSLISRVWALPVQIPSA